MTREETLLRRLAVEIESELASLARLEQELAAAPEPANSYSLRARGSILHDFYTGIERIFMRLASELNGGVPRSPQWHQELIRNMARAIPEVRPAVIHADLAGKMNEYLRFRHEFRHVCASVRDPARMQPLEQQVPAALAAFRDQIEGFLAWMLGRLPA